MNDRSRVTKCCGAEVLFKSHRPQPCSFCHSGFFRNLFRPKKFEFCTNFSSENCVRSNSPFSMFSVCSCFEKSFLCLCQFTDSKNIGRFRKRNLPATIPGDTEFQAEHEYENRLVKFVKLRLLSGKQISWNFECKCWFLSVLGFFYVSKKRARLGPMTRVCVWCVCVWPLDRAPAAGPPIFQLSYSKSKSISTQHGSRSPSEVTFGRSAKISRYTTIT